MKKLLSILHILLYISIIFASVNALKLNDYCNGGKSRCVHLLLCKDGVIITDGASVITQRFPDECVDNSLVCCSLNSTEHHSTCGFRNKNGIGYNAAGANEAKFGEFPWVVGLLNQNSEFFCAGSIISNRVILTAAHCVHEKLVGNIKIRAGEWDRNVTAEILSYAEYGVQEVIIHEDFKLSNHHNNIALLILKDTVKFFEHINTICLPPQNFSFDGNKGCIVTGWGKDPLQGENYVSVLKKIEPPLIPFHKCQDEFRKTALGIDFKLHESFICAGDEQNDSCRGDGGGALFCPIEGNPDYYHQAGIVSWGMGCKKSTGGVYVNVAKFRSWIDQKIKSQELPTTSYNRI